MVKIQQGSKGNNFLTIPALVMRMKNWKKGDELAVLIDSRSGDAVIRKVEQNGA